MSHLHALLIGIDTYAASNEMDQLKDLSACVNDVNNFANYLSLSLPRERLIVEKLINQDATKQGIEDKIREFFLSDNRQISDEDTLLFYYSGHGCQEEADPGWKEKDNQLEALVCHDTYVNGTPPFSDKELRYLFHLISLRTKARIVLITDACNSGGLSRDLSQLTNRLGPQAGVRPWDQFLFSTGEHEPTVSKAVLTDTNLLETSLPESIHIHMGACESYQSAFEVPGQQGVFSKNLLHILEQTQDSISFRDLHARVRYRVRQKYSQFPTLYAKGLKKDQIIVHDLLDGTFLTGLESQRKVLANVFKQHGKWRLDKGAIHGIPPKQAVQKLNIQILDDTDETFSLGKLKEVKPAFSVIDSVNPENLQVRKRLGTGPKKEYQARISGLYNDPLVIYIGGTDRLIADLKSLLDEASIQVQLQELNIEWVDDPMEASYQLLASEEGYTLTHAGETLAKKEDFPLLDPIRRNTANLAEQLLRYLSHIAHWNFVRALHNPKPKTNLKEVLKWELIWQPALGDHTKDIAMQEYLEEITFNPDKEAEEAKLPDPFEYPDWEIELAKPRLDEEAFGYLRLWIQNLSEKPLYISLLYMGHLFQVNSRTMPRQKEVVRLGGKEKIWGLGNESIGSPVYFRPYERDKRNRGQMFYLKLIVSNSPFELSGSLNQTRLPFPGENLAKDGIKQEQGPVQGYPDGAFWLTKILRIRVLNPDYQASP
ncbi:MAG: caspase family protein [Bacteroidia bacterium]|nr:caspase family protein [Bacteroidia bacterium]